MSNNYKKIFNLLLTDKNISLLDLNTDATILKNYHRKVSILETYKKEITDYIEKYELKKINLIFLNNIDTYYNIFLRNKKIETFTKKLVGDKNNLTTNQKNIEIFISKNDILINNYIGYNENLYFINPLNTYPEDINIINRNDYDEDVNIIIDILTHGKIINISLPSIGRISNKVSSDDKTIINFIDKIIIINNSTDFNNIINDLPLKHLGLDETISNLLLDIPIDNKNFNTNNNENNVRNLIKDMIKNISINENDIFKIKGKNNKEGKNGKNTSSFKKEFIIPYIREGDKIRSMTKAEIDKKTTIDKVINNNNDLITYVTSKYDITNKTLNEKNREIYKNIMACYLFYIINLIISIMDIYIDKINNDVLLNIINLKEKRFKILNIESTFDYILSFKKSILKFKIILLNNFYNLFIPSKINFGNYGMKMSDEGCYKPECIFLKPIEDIFKNYPFKNNTTDKKILKDFIINIKKNNDLYKENLILEMGGFAFNYKKTEDALSSVKNTCLKIIKINNFNLFIIDKIIYYFQNKSIPYELINIDDIIMLMRSTLLNSKKNNKEKLQKKLIRKYEDNIGKSTSNYINLIEIRNKIKFSEKNNLNSLYNKRDEFLLNFNIYYMISECIKKITENDVYSSNLKNKLLEEYSRIKKEYEENISDYIKK